MESKSLHLGVNRSSKSIKKSPLHQPNNFLHPPPSDPPPPSSDPPQQPQVYNISKNDFRSLVQQLTSHNPPINPPNPNFSTPMRHQNPHFNPPPSSQNHHFNIPPRPPPLKPASQRLQKIRPPPLAPIARPSPAAPANANLNPTFNPNPNFNHNPSFNYNHNPNPNPGFNQNTSFGRPPAESPVSVYMRYLESSITNSDGSSGRPPVPPLLPSPRGDPMSFLSPRGAPPLPPWPMPPQSPALLPSPLLSPSTFLNLASPRSPYPLLSPGFQYPPPLTPNFAFSGSGILGAGPGAPPLSPGLMFPQSPSAFLLSPRWREM